MGNNKRNTCWIGLHSDDIHKEIPLTDIKNNKIGLVIINRCANCGRVKSTKIRTVDTL